MTTAYRGDGSRQSKSVNADVAGIGFTARIAISDVALPGASLEEVRSVTGHEIGHLVPGHVWRLAILVSALERTAEFRYPRPSALREVAFHSHPSVERRVHHAMDWKAEHGGR